MESSRRDKLEERPRSLPAEGRLSTGRVPGQTVTLKGQGKLDVSEPWEHGLGLEVLGSLQGFSEGLLQWLPSFTL